MKISIVHTRGRGQNLWTRLLELDLLKIWKKLRIYSKVEKCKSCIFFTRKMSIMRFWFFSDDDFIRTVQFEGGRNYGQGYSDKYNFLNLRDFQA